MRNVGNVGFVGSDSGLWLPGHQMPLRLPNAKFQTYPLNDPEAISDLLGWFSRDFGTQCRKMSTRRALP